MRTVVAALLFPILLAACGGSEPAPAPGLRIRLLAIDGADFDIVRGLIAKGRLPAFAKALEQGAHGKLSSEAPRHAAIVFTTLATGRPPADHGIRSFVVTDHREERLLPIASFMRRTETVWEILSAKGRTVSVTGWPGTWPPDPVRGRLVPDRFFAADAETDVHPPDSAAGLLPLLRMPREISDAVIDQFVTRPAPDDRLDRLKLALAEEESRRAVARNGPEDARLSVDYSNLVGVTSYLFMSCASPRLPRIGDREFASYGQAVVAAYEYTDRRLSEAMAATGPGSVLLVVSPYGFRHDIQRLSTDAGPGDRRAADHHRPRGFFLAFGEGVRAGTEIRGAKVVDVAPTVLALAGFPAGEDMPGRYLAAAFELPAPEGRVDTWERGRRERIFREVHGEEGDADLRIEDHRALAYIGNTIRLSDPTNLALLHYHNRNMRSAYAALQRAFAAEPGSAYAHGLMGDVQLKAKEYGVAETEFREALRLEPDSIIYASRLARILLRLGRAKEAFPVALEARRREPADAALHQLIARIQLSLGRDGEAEESLRTAIRLEPDAVEVRTDLGLFLLERGRELPAASHFRAVVDLEPELRSGWNNLAVALLRHAERQDDDPAVRAEVILRASKVLDEMVERFPDYLRAWQNRAQVHLLRGDRKAALRDVERALAIDPDYAPAVELKKTIEAE